MKDILQLHKNIKIRLIILFFQRIIGQMILPFMTIFLAKELSVQIAGYISISGIIGGLLASFIGGYLSDVVGRKPVIILAEFLSFIFAFSMFLSSNIIVIAIGYLLFLFSSNFSKPAVESMIVDVSDINNRKFVYTLIYWLNNISFSIGGFLGAFLFTGYFKFILLSQAILSLIFLCIYWKFISETKPKTSSTSQDKRKNNILHSYLECFKNKAFLLLFIASSLIMVSEFQLSNFIAVNLSNQNVLFKLSNYDLTGIELYGVLRTENTIGVVILVYFINRLLYNITLKNQLVIGLIFYTLGYSVLVISKNPQILVLFMVLATIGEVILVPSKQSLLAEVIPDSNRSLYIAFYGLFERFGLLLASILLIFSDYLKEVGIALILIVIGIVSFLLLNEVIGKINIK